MKHSSIEVVSSSALDEASSALFDVIPSAGATAYGDFGKRAFDIGMAVLALPAVVPVVTVLWLVVRKRNAPGFFAQERVGRGGKTFRCWKLRTMEPDADARLSRHLAQDPDAAEEWARDRKLRDDPRVTAFGRLLRKTSLDELPQIWNVLRGEMSFVGPRPVVPEEMPLYGRSAWAYLKGRPGITGLWQISGRNDVSYDRRVALDVEYRQRESLGTDIRIVLATVTAVLGATGN